MSPGLLGFPLPSVGPEALEVTSGVKYPPEHIPSELNVGEETDGEPG